MNTIEDRLSKLQREVSKMKKSELHRDLAKAHWDGIAKPLDGLGKLEEIICEIAAMTENEAVSLNKRAVIAMCADNGIVEEGITQSGQEVTAVVAANMAKGIASVCRMAQKANTEVIPVDIGIGMKMQEPGLVNKKVRKGTRNFLKEPAMTAEETLQAIEVGIEIVKDCRAQNYQILATGEMGIGNTTTSAALASVLLKLPVKSVTGQGAGLDEKGISRKVQVISQGIEKYKLTAQSPFDALQCVGGLDIAGLVGVYVGGALYQIPVIIDGVISSIAALCAERIFPGCSACMIASHMSKEPAGAAIMRELGFSPMIHGELSLGEGTGAVLLLPMLDMALEVYRENTTFGDLHVPKYKRYERTEV